MLVSSDGENWTRKEMDMNLSTINQSGLITGPGASVIMGGAASAGYSEFMVINQYSYDPATQFYVPAPVTAEGIPSYIKALVA